MASRSFGPTHTSGGETNKMATETNTSSTAATPGSTGKVSPMQENIRQLVRQKERELHDLTEFRFHALQDAESEREKEFQEFKVRYAKIKEDFQYNLHLLEERDAELDKYDSSFTNLKNVLRERENEISDCRITIADLNTRLKSKDTRLDDQTTLYQKQVDGLRNELQLARSEIESSRRLGSHDVELVRQEMQKKQLLQESQFAAQRRELVATLEAEARESDQEHTTRVQHVQLLLAQQEARVISLQSEIKVLTTSKQEYKDSFDQVNANHVELQVRMQQQIVLHGEEVSGLHAELQGAAQQLRDAEFARHQWQEEQRAKGRLQEQEVERLRKQVEHTQALLDEAREENKRRHGNDMSALERLGSELAEREQSLLRVQALQEARGKERELERVGEQEEMQRLADMAAKASKLAAQEQWELQRQVDSLTSTLASTQSLLQQRKQDLESAREEARSYETQWIEATRLATTRKYELEKYKLEHETTVDQGDSLQLKMNVLRVEKEAAIQAQEQYKHLVMELEKKSDKMAALHVTELRKLKEEYAQALEEATKGSMNKQQQQVQQYVSSLASSSSSSSSTRDREQRGMDPPVSGRQFTPAFSDDMGPASVRSLYPSSTHRLAAGANTARTTITSTWRKGAGGEGEELGEDVPDKARGGGSGNCEACSKKEQQNQSLRVVIGQMRMEMETLQQQYELQQQHQRQPEQQKQQQEQRSMNQPTSSDRFASDNEDKEQLRTQLKKTQKAVQRLLEQRDQLMSISNMLRADLDRVVAASSPQQVVHPQQDESIRSTPAVFSSSSSYLSSFPSSFPSFPSSFSTPGAFYGGMNPSLPEASHSITLPPPSSAATTATTVATAAIATTATAAERREQRERHYQLQRAAAQEQQQQQGREQEKGVSVSGHSVTMQQRRGGTHAAVSMIRSTKKNNQQKSSSGGLTKKKDSNKNKPARSSVRNYALGEEE